MLLTGYGLATVCLAVQVLLAEWANRSQAPRISAYVALPISGIGAGAASCLELTEHLTLSGRVLEVLLVGVMLAGMLTMLRALSRELALDRARG